MVTVSSHNTLLSINAVWMKQRPMILLCTPGTSHMNFNMETQHFKYRFPMFQCSVFHMYVSLKIIPSHIWKMSAQNQVCHWELAVIVTNYRSYWSCGCKDSAAVVLYNCGFSIVFLQSNLFMVCLKILYCQIGWFVQNLEGSSYGLFEETE